jgi:hypothetical protein
MLAMGTGLYKEQVRWRDAATGRLLAESDLFEPMSPNTLVTPGYGGRVYFPTDLASSLGPDRILSVSSQLMWFHSHVMWF